MYPVIFNLIYVVRDNTKCRNVTFYLLEEKRLLLSYGLSKAFSSACIRILLYGWGVVLNIKYLNE